jgi:membrane complex biogenesis BtpA family protein
MSGHYALPPKAVIGMLHLLPLPGSPCAVPPAGAGRGSASAAVLAAARELLLADADKLVAGGCHALMMENFGDTPFFPGRVPATVVAAMTALAADVKRRHPQVPLGINVLRNDGESALAIAAAVGAEFIRVNVLCGARVTDQGVIQGIAHDLLRLRKSLDAERVAILADVDVKHSAPLAARPIEHELDDMVKRGMADAVIVSGSGTGAQVDLAKLARVKAAAGKTPVLIGSGVTAAALKDLVPHADGFIVGTSLKADGKVEQKRVEALLRALGDLVR